MILFLLFLIPLFVFFILFNEQRLGKTFRIPGFQFFLGIVVFFPTLILFSLMKGFLAQSYTGSGFYFYHFFYDHFLFLAGAVGWFFSLKNQLLKNADQHPFPVVLLFFGGYYSGVTVFDYLERITHLDLYALFLLPLLTLATVLLLTVCIVQFFSQYGLFKYLSLAGCLALPFLVNIPTVFAHRNYDILAIAGVLVLAGGAVFALFKLRDA